jgi:gamma-glutamylcyclotransferase (GGCT)/AIG2-like uncharacterized protein YtfP
MKQAKRSSRDRQSCMKLFVYGTLKRGHSRARHLAGQRFLGEARTVSRYRLYDCGRYPGLVPAAEGLAIEGEVWDVTEACLRVLDDVDGVAAGLYQRGLVQLEAPFDTQPVETYFFQQSITGLADCSPRWE